MKQVGAVVNKIQERKRFHDIVMFLGCYVFEMFPIDKDPGKKSVLFISYFELVVVFIVKLEVNHLMQFVCVVFSEKILTCEKFSVFSDFGSGDFMK